MLISCMKLPRFPNFFRKKKLRVLFLGLDGVGKTTIINRLKTKDIVQSIPTIGSNVEEIEVNKSVKLTIWDVGGEKKLRHLWKYHYQVSDGLVFVVDSVNAEKLQEARTELFTLLANDEFHADIPVVIFANKQDLRKALKVSDIIDRLGLKEIKTNSWLIQPVSAVSGDGIHDGLKKLIAMQKFSTKQAKGDVNLKRIPRPIKDG